MAANLSVPDDMRESVRAFIESEAIPLNIVAGESGAVRVMESEKGRESTPTVLEAGGWIACGIARSMAAKLDISSGSMGKLLTHLDIKIRDCELGCFE